MVTKPKPEKRGETQLSCYTNQKTKKKIEKKSIKFNTKHQNFMQDTSKVVETSKNSSFSYAGNKKISVSPATREAMQALSAKFTENIGVKRSKSASRKYKIKS